mmetsp:Transcript_20243/g.52684  ORF Transcript_20243/g.52684 Transcript_20243/m.52684 type:complete len:134 (-) Transcript_20243:36-437(-)
MTRTPKAASAARTGPSTTASDAQPVDEDAAAPAPAPAPADDGSDSDSSDGEIPLCDAPVIKKRKVETVATSNVTLTDSERYKRDDAGCAARLKAQEPELLPCIDPEIGEDDQGVGARFQGYDGFTIGGPPVFR